MQPYGIVRVRGGSESACRSQSAAVELNTKTKGISIRGHNQCPLMKASANKTYKGAYVQPRPTDYESRTRFASIEQQNACMAVHWRTLCLSRCFVHVCGFLERGVTMQPPSCAPQQESQNGLVCGRPNPCCATFDSTMKSNDYPSIDWHTHVCVCVYYRLVVLRPSPQSCDVPLQGGLWCSDPMSLQCTYSAAHRVNKPYPLPGMKVPVCQLRSAVVVICVCALCVPCHPGL